MSAEKMSEQEKEGKAVNKTWRQKPLYCSTTPFPDVSQSEAEQREGRNNNSLCVCQVKSSQEKRRREEEGTTTAF